MVLLVLVAAVVLARGTGDGGEAPPPVVATSWPDVLAELDEVRTSAWAGGDAAPLREVDVEGSAAARADLAALAALRRRGVRAEGLRVAIETVGVVTRSPGRVRLRVVDRRSSYVLRARTGEVAERVAARGPRAWEVELAHTGERWRFVSVAPLS